MCRNPIVVALRLFALAIAALLAGCGGGGGGGASTTSTFSKSYGGPFNDEARVVLNAEDGGFMLFGSANGDDLHPGPPFTPGR